MSKMKAYHRQKWDAKKRGIPWRFTFEEWVAVWESALGSDWFQKRGCTKGKYVMARNGDKGPYSPSNIRIVTCETNHKEAVINGRSNAGEKNGTAKLTNEMVKNIFLAQGKNADIARQFGIPPQRVCKIKKRLIWRSTTEGL